MTDEIMGAANSPEKPTLDERVWKWTLRIAGLGIAVYEVKTLGRVYVLTMSMGMMGLPTVLRK